MGDLRKKTHKGIAWVLGAAIAKFAWRICSVAILARYLGPEDYGPWSLVMVAVGITLALFGSGLGPSIVVTENITRLEYRAISSMVGLAGVAFGILIAWLVPIYVQWRQPEVFVEGLAYVAAVVLAMEMASLVPIAILQRELSFSRLAKIEFGSFLAGSLLSIALVVLFDFGVWAVASGKIFQSATRFVAAFATAPFLLLPTARLHLVGRFLRRARGFLRGGACSSIALHSDNWIIGIVGGAISLSIYEKAYNLAKLPVGLLGQSIQKVLFPSFAKAKDDSTGLRDAYQLYFRTALFLGMILSLLVAVLSPEIVRILLGEKWLAVTLPLSIMAPSIAFRISFKIPASVLKSSGELRAWSNAYIVYAFLVATGALLGSLWGPSYVAAAVSSSAFVVFLIMATHADRYLGLKSKATISTVASMLAITAPAATGAWLLAYFLRSLSMPSIVIVVSAVAANLLLLSCLVFCFASMLGLEDQLKNAGKIGRVIARRTASICM